MIVNIDQRNTKKTQGNIENRAILTRGQYRKQGNMRYIALLLTNQKRVFHSSMRYKHL